MTEQMNVPMLRFGEYAGDWHTTTVGQLVKDGILFKPLDGNHGNIHPKASDYVESGIPFLMASDIQHGQADLEGCKFISKELADSLQKGFACEGDVLLTHKGTVGETTILQGINTPYVMLTPQVTYYRVKNSEKLDNVFLQKLFTSESFRKDLFVKADSGTRPYIGILGQLTLNLTLPEIDEQQKIASFLSKFDEKIALLTAKKNKLTEYKKGVMQRLFNGKWGKQDGQLTFIPPTLRFKADDGSEFPDWKEKKFGDCFDFFTTNSLSRDKLSYDMGMIKNIHYGDIHTKFRSIFKPEQELVPYIAELDDTKKIKPQSYCQNGDLVFADASEDYADIGKCIEVRELGNLKLVAGLHTHLARPKEKFATGYQAYLQKSWKMRYQIMRIAQGTKVLGISTKQLATIYLPVPCYEEQEKIAAFLTSLDSKIECLEFELNKSKEWKKGLLQQMFV
ncbi:restriction endonuclease subunit S [Vibrio parahaemolyticus]|uniref:restriction endonuclease subunit S n=4 Tax=Vibrio TaxID=662 RepID=UPI00112171FE|nr:restriction endonuclease subunit S [Vibrio parahaemolyticus]EGQ8608268.1 hypothetical protein [Vibrio parahaemolyticus]MBE4222996.1 hypothetical protein [Vibrio parahaemolyticus]MDF4484795.1 restriction endonuclease subunit S [Vibrio parahaemolyticus]MDF4508828.1 restriction endonuclease subunit S [Vibrio parahaemolyticus]MDF4531344.1 restriction endonuclease subunit S [Vibrio parahaemolyticus]